MSALVVELCLTLCDAVDCSLPGSSVHGILQARILEWVAISFSRRSSRPRDRTWVSRMASRFLASKPPTGTKKSESSSGKKRSNMGFLCPYSFLAQHPCGKAPMDQTCASLLELSCITALHPGGGNGAPPKHHFLPLSFLWHQNLLKHFLLIISTNLCCLNFNF